MITEIDGSSEAAPSPSRVASASFDALSKKDLDALTELMADAAVDDFVAFGEVHGKPAIRGFFEALLTAFPDFDMTVDQIVGGPSSAVVQWHATGTFSGGTFLGLEPTGHYVSLRGVDVMEIADGLVRHNTIYYDGADFARQAGGMRQMADPNPNRDITILVVEDEDVLRVSTADVLRQQGYDVIEATDGVEALENLAEEDVDVVILDLRMPRLDGAGVLDALSHDHPPVVVVTGRRSTDEGDLRELLGPRSYAWVQKPLLPERLLSIAADAAGRRTSESGGPLSGLR